MELKKCAYCGIEEVRLEKEHVIPRALYPRSKMTSKVQRITVKACGPCNRGFSADEPHFRNMMLIAGEPNEAVKELWDQKACPSFSKEDGEKRVKDLYEQMRPELIDGRRRYKVYPHEDLQTIRVLRKVVRGLSAFHKIEAAIVDDRVVVRPAIFQLPEDLDASLTAEHREEDIIRYRFCVAPWEGISSFWELTFFERRTFFAIVEDRDTEA